MSFGKSILTCSFVRFKIKDDDLSISNFPISMRDKMSCFLFWNGVPVKNHDILNVKDLERLNLAVFGFLKLWASSKITRFHFVC